MAISVSSAYAFDAQTIRVRYTNDAKDFTALGNADALNPDNYDVTVIAYPAMALGLAAPPDPIPLKVSRVKDSTGAFVVTDFDISVDAVLRHNVTYRVTVSNVTDEGGIVIAPPVFADLPGVFTVPLVPKRLRTVGNDFAVDMRTGRVLQTASGDIALFGQKAALLDRILKRITIAAGGFYHLPDYGLGLKPKSAKISTSSLPELRNDILAQLGRESDLVDPDVGLSSRQDTAYSGVLVVDVKGSMSTGAPVTATFPFLKEPSEAA